MRNGWHISHYGKCNYIDGLIFGLRLGRYNVCLFINNAIISVEDNDCILSKDMKF